LASTDHDYENPVAQLHVGERLHLKVTDADLDVSDERDRATVEISSSRGEKETLLLEETLAHSGVFTGSASLKPSETPTPGNLVAAEPVIETYFGDVLRIKYVDMTATTESGTLDLEIELPVASGADGIVGAFSKTFDDEQLAVETQFHIAESYFELFKSHKQLGRKDDQQADLEAGRRVLKEVMQDYPSPKHAPRVAYLLGQFSQELRQWDEAIASYQLIVRQFPDSSLAADAQYKLAQCLEESGDFDNALEAYVTLAATYPKSPLIANVMVRISDHFYKKENYLVSAEVGQKFLQRFEGHEWAPRMAFRVGQCYYKAKLYAKAASAFDKFIKIFPDDALGADSLFWAGESFRSANDMPQAFRRYNRCRWDFPASEAAKYARGRLALPEMLTQFEAESKVE
jgi:TolA-binding protein